MMNTLLEDTTLTQHECYHIIPCAVSEVIKQWAVSQLEEAQSIRDSSKALIAVAQLTGPCVLEEFKD